MTVNDGKGGTVNATFAWPTTNTNRAPALTAIGGKTVAENGTLSFVITATDADGEALTFTATGLPSGASFTPGSRSFAWTPGFTQAGTYHVIFTVTDVNAAGDSEDVTIVVANTNRVPVAQPESYGTPAGATLTIGAPGLLGNDADLDGTPLNAVLATGLVPGSGTLTLGTGGGFTYTPGPFLGIALFTYRASDGTDTSAPVTVTIAVNGENVNQTLPANGASQTVTSDSPTDDGPGATPTDPVETSVTTPTGMVGTIAIAEASPNGAAPAGYSFLGSQVHITAPAAASATSPLVLKFRFDATLLSGQNENTVQIFKSGVLVPACTGAAGTASPDPCVSGRLRLADADVEITVLTTTASPWQGGKAANSPPVANGQSVTAGTATATPITLTASDPDPLTFTVVTPPAHGTLMGTAPNLTYTSAAGYTGADSFTFKANDGTGDSNVATVSITVVTQKATTTGLILTSSPVQYSDRMSMDATLTPPVGETASPASSVTFKIGTQVLGTQPLTYSAGVWRAQLANYQLLETSPAGQLRPGTRIVTAVFNDVNQNFAVSNPVKTVLINKEDAQISYTGARGSRAVQTENVLSGRAAIVLSATVAEIAGDTNVGDIRNATIMFVNRETGATIATVPVAANGSATFTWNVDILLLPSKVYNIGMVVGNYYVRNSTLDDVSIEVYKQ